MKVIKYPFLTAFLTFFFLHLSTVASNTPVYWKQALDYKIDIALDDEKKELNGRVIIKYSNKSTDTLNYIYFHIYPNAFKNYQTAFSKQLLINLRTDYWFSNSSQKGWIDGLNFKVNQKDAGFQINDTFIDIGKLILNEPLLPNQSIEISTPFHVKLPFCFSRLGYSDSTFQITQWYPKPAVYDKDGWHAVPYLDQGEFYSEFGNYLVNITAKSNYSIASTGNLIAQKVQADYTTRTFEEKNIHDFAWFASSKFLVKKDSFLIDDSLKISEVFYPTDLLEYSNWREANKYLNRSTAFYSKHIGNYPYRKVAAVKGSLKAGEGMEYPTITVVTDDSYDELLDEIITHEVGHNWFYGMLGSNERKYTWMDEGLNSLYELKYMNEYYGNYVHEFGRFAKYIFGLDHLKRQDLFYYLYQYMSANRRDQALNINADEFTYANYAIMNYGKTALGLMQLEHSLGKEHFENKMKNYFREWQFKHPQPADFELYFNDSNKQDWFFRDLLNTTKTVDYSVYRVNKNSITLKNKGEIPAPTELHIQYSDRTIDTIKIDGFFGKKTWNLPQEIQKATIDPNRITIDINRQNHFYNRHALFRKPIKYRILPGVPDPKYHYVYLSPTIGANGNDGFMLGTALYNNLFTPHKLNWMLNPMFGFDSKSLVGNASAGLNLYNKQKVNFQASINLKRHAYRYFTNSFSNGEEHLFYNKMGGRFSVNYRSGKEVQPTDHSFYYTNNQIWLEEDFYENNALKVKPYYYQINELGYKRSKIGALFSYHLESKINQREANVNIQTECNLQFKYAPKGYFNWRLYGAAYVYREANTLIGVALSNNTAAGGYQPHDYAFDETFLQRNNALQNTFLAHQVALNEGGFRSFINLGIAENYLFSSNLEMKIPKIPIVLFASLAFGDFMLYNNIKTPQLAAEGGISLVILKDILEVHFPILITNNIMDDHLKGATKEKIVQRLTFTLNLRNFNPHKDLNVLNRL